MLKRIYGKMFHNYNNNIYLHNDHVKLIMQEDHVNISRRKEYQSMKTSAKNEDTDNRDILEINNTDSQTLKSSYKLLY